MVEAYPLYWPADYPRSRSKKRSRFTTTLGAARDFVKDEIRRIGGINPIISTNIPLKDNGDLRADWTRFKVDDTGVAVYFTYKKNPVCLCCDTYEKVWDNLRAVGRTIEALRQIDRDGVSDFLNRTFSGFKALPAGDVTNSKSVWDILGVPMGASEKAIKEAYRQKAKQLHTDTGGGDHEKMVWGKGDSVITLPVSKIVKFRLSRKKYSDD